MSDPEKRVLVVDDDIDYAEAQAEALELHGYITKVAGNSTQAIDIVKKWRPQVALLDNSLGQEFGVDLVPKLKAIDANIMCAIVTAFGTAETAIQALRHGAEDFLHKPVSMPALFRCLNNCFERHKLKVERDQAQDALRESQASLAEAQVLAHIGNWDLDMVSGALRWSDEIYRIFGLSPQQFGATYEAFLEAIHPDDRSTVEAAVGQSIEDGSHYRIEHRVVQPDGAERWVEEQGYAHFNDAGEPIRMTGTVQDITERRQAAQDLERLNAELKLRIGQVEDFADTASDWFWETDADHRYTYMSGRNEIVTGLSTKSDVLGNTRSEALAGRLPDWEVADTKKWQQHQDMLDRHEPFSGFQYAINLPDGGTSHVNLGGKPIFSEVGDFLGYRGSGTDITAAKESEAELERLARFDALTSLPNRALFSDRLEMALNGAQRHNGKLALMFLDLDRFKQINDSLGHKVGDGVLITVAERLKQCVREVDTVARLAGDEFTIILDDISDPLNIEEVARRIVESLSEPMFIEDQKIVTTASLGIAVYPGDGEDASTLTHHADQAMYAAKGSSGGAYQYYSAAMSKGVEKQLELEADLREALTKEQFEIHFQPRFDLGTGQVSGAEALLRWRHPERGLVAPLDFIPTAEKTGLIVPIGQYVINEVCRQAREWQDTGQFDGAISLNISTRQLTDENLIEDFRRALEAWDVLAEKLEIELTETVIMNFADDSVEMLRDLKNLGLKISLDDFGTGYSSLAYLKKLPVDALKIDRAFVQEIDANEKSGALVNSILSIASSLGLSVVAEGVENAIQADSLGERGCYEMQGFFYSPAIEASRFPGVVTNLNRGIFAKNLAAAS